MDLDFEFSTERRIAGRAAVVYVITGRPVGSGVAMEFIAVPVPVNIGPGVAEPVGLHRFTLAGRTLRARPQRGRRAGPLESFTTPIAYVPGRLPSTEIAVFGALVAFFAIKDDVFKFEFSASASGIRNSMIGVAKIARIEASGSDF